MRNGAEKQQTERGARNQMPKDTFCTEEGRMTRKEVLEQAIKCVCGQREQDYGSPEDNFYTIARMWTAYLEGAYGDVPLLTPKDVAMMMVLLKVARTASGDHPDNYVDIAGYAACAGENISQNPMNYCPYCGAKMDMQGDKSNA